MRWFFLCDTWIAAPMATEERDALIIRAGWIPLVHRSRECRCVLANAKDLTTWSGEDVDEIEFMENALGEQKRRRGEVDLLGNKFMFRPSTKKGNPNGIREVVKWANQLEQDRATKKETGEPVEMECDSGYCTG